MIAQYLAIERPELIGKLVLTVTSPYANDSIRDCITKWIRYAEHGKYKELMIDTAEMSYSVSFLRKYRKLYPFFGIVGSPSDFTRFLINANAILGFYALGELNRIVCSTCIIGGDADKVVGAEA